MSSHREAPHIAEDQYADNTDVYAFVSPDRPDTVTLIANYIPFQKPDGGPNFFAFAPDVCYDIHISNRGKSESDITYRFHFQTDVRNPKTFLYNTGPITKLSDTTWNRPQFYSVTRVKNGKKTVLAERLACPPVNVGPRSTPSYHDLATQAVHKIGKHQVFAGQRCDAFHVDLGGIFDLGTLRPFQNLHLIPSAAAAGVNGLQSFNVHSIVLQVPIKEITRNGDVPTDPMSPGSVIGVWATASRRKSRIFDQESGSEIAHGPWEQVSRLGNPLFNEVIVPVGKKDQWNARFPKNDHAFAQYVNHPELARLLPVLYPGVFPNLAAYHKPRADLNAVLLTGIPKGIVPGFQNFTGTTEADMLRLNVAIPPSPTPNALGVLGGDLAGFPNGRRVEDDVTTIELRAVAGLTIPLVDPSFTPDGAASGVTDGTTDTNGGTTMSFPYLGDPGGGYQTMPGTSSVA
jgi:hypothetical protein